MRQRRPTPDSTIFVGLTGGIGAGKSTALECLERLGCGILSADAVVHEVQSDPDVVRQLADRFGDEVAPHGEIDRGALAEAAFSSQEERAWLEGLIWPLVGGRITEWREGQVADPPPSGIAVIEVPLLFESGMDAAFDLTLCITSPDATRLERAAARGQAALQQRESRQLSQQEKSRRADFTVENDGTVDQLEALLSGVLGRIRE